MSFASAAALLVQASLKNRVRRLIRQPRNVIFLLIGGAYFVSLGATRMIATTAHARVAADPSHVPLWLAFAVLVYLAVIWLFGSDTAALAFTEAEVDFLFAAPVTRRQLVHYKLVRTILGSFVTGAFFAVVLRRGGQPLFATVGLALSISTIALHRVCASMTRASLLSNGVPALKRRIVTLAVLVAVVVGVVASIARLASSLPVFDPADPGVWLQAFAAWADAHEASLAWILFPLAAMARVTSATGASQFLGALPAALAVLGVHYAWALSTDVAFEESSAEAARRNARRVEDLRAGRMGPVPRTRPLFRLAATGAPWMALFWKNLIAGQRISRRQLVVWAIAFFAVPLVAVGTAGHWRATIAPFLIGLAVFTSFLGPHMVRNDLRQDIEHIDVLRSLPLAARDVVVGELLAPLAMLTVVEWAILFASAGVGWVTNGRGVAFIAVGCAFALPAITACMLVLRNAGALWFPSMAGATAQEFRGLEAFGQRLLLVFGTLAVLAIVLVPAGIAGAIVAWIGGSWLGLGVAPFTGMVAAVVAFAEAFAGLFVVARAFEGFEREVT